MIVVDTSVWIEANRRPAGEVAHALRGLLDADAVAVALPVRIELVPRAARKDRRKLKRLLAATPLLFPTEETWRIVESSAGRASDAGYTFGMSDLLIAALTDEIGGLVWSLDHDFDEMAKVGLVQLYEPPASV